jgi:hypothetical protein
VVVFGHGRFGRTGINSGQLGRKEVRDLCAKVEGIWNCDCTKTARGRKANVISEEYAPEIRDAVLRHLRRLSVADALDFRVDTASI